MNVDIDVGSNSEWGRLFDHKMEIIVDPMIFRAGDVFLRGKKGAMAALSAKDPAQIMTAIAGDVGSLTSFFDQLVLAEALPVIDYGITFDSTLGYDTPWICQQVNEVFGEKMLWAVHVHSDASEEARSSALEQLPACPRPAGELEASVRKHLNALDYQWRPSLGSMEAQLGEAQLEILRFLYGGLVFSAFARASGAAHLLQPKRAKLSVALALSWPASRDGDEASLYAELKRRLAADPDTKDLAIEFAGLPSVLPYLISKAENHHSPMHLLQGARRLRNSAAMADYRSWRRDLLESWRKRGTIKRGTERDIKRMLVAARKALSLSGPIDIEAGVGVEAGPTGIALKPTVRTKLDISQLWWGWVNPVVPGKRYTKLLTRMRLADYELARPGAALASFWDRG
jgi:hypothetical protein